MPLLPPLMQLIEALLPPVVSLLNAIMPLPTFHKSDYPIREVILSQSTIAALRLSAGGKANLP